MTMGKLQIILRKKTVGGNNCSNNELIVNRNKTGKDNDNDKISSKYYLDKKIKMVSYKRETSRRW